MVKWYNGGKCSRVGTAALGLLGFRRIIEVSKHAAATLGGARGFGLLLGGGGACLRLLQAGALRGLFGRRLFLLLLALLGLVVTVVVERVHEDEGIILVFIVVVVVVIVVVVVVVALGHRVQVRRALDGRALDVAWTRVCECAQECASVQACEYMRV